MPTQSEKALSFKICTAWTPLDVYVLSAHDKSIKFIPLALTAIQISEKKIGRPTADCRKEQLHTSTKLYRMRSAIKNKAIQNAQKNWTTAEQFFTAQVSVSEQQIHQ